VGFSAERFSGGEPFAPWRSTPIAADDSCSDKMRGICHRSPYGTMFVPSTDAHGKELLTWFLADSRARTSARQVAEQELTGKGADCGLKWRGSFAKYDQNSCSWKTHQRLLLGGLEGFSEIWPRWGIMLNGEVFEQETMVPRLKGSEFLLPAPTKSMGQSGWGIAKKQRYSKVREENARIFGYKPHPAVLEWSMGWPITWSLSVPLETDRFQQWLDSMEVFDTMKTDYKTCPFNDYHVHDNLPVFGCSHIRSEDLLCVMAHRKPVNKFDSTVSCPFR